MSDIRILTRPVGAYETNCHLVWREGAGECVLVDPGADAGELLGILDARKLVPAAYLLTHGHGDHVCAVAELAARHPAPVYLAKEDARWAFTALNKLPGYPPPAAPPPSSPLLAPPSEGTPLSLAGMDFDVLRTPGHTPGGVVWRLAEAGVLFTGDTLFAGSAGRTDLPGGDWETLLESLGRLAWLDGDATVYPGHGPSTTLAEERAHNPFLRAVRE
ncbi:MAG: MBL fold metallo-hydrolase [Kiritimatiellae bacterium]|nr:MBL fold metallo-hydrolase [Kiritimatiellia bacterium]